MKKLILTGALAMFAAGNAQTFGLKAGMNVSSLTNADGAESKIGFNGGLFMNSALAENFSIQPEFLYNSKGAKDNGVFGDMSLNLDYISVPVMFQYNATPQFYLEAGPEFSFLASAKAKGAGATVDVKDEMNSFDFGVGLGAGYYFIPNFGITARYVAGFMDIVKDNTDDAVKNNVFQIGLAYKFAK